MTKIKAKKILHEQFIVRPDWTKSANRSKELTWLDKNENGDPVYNKKISTILHTVSPEALFAYPDSAHFYHKLADFLGVDATNLIINSGSDGIIRSVYEAFLNPGDLIFLTRPTFAMYDVYAKVYGAVVQYFDYTRHHETPLLDVPHLIHEIQEKRPKLVCLPNPDSPTGTIVEPTLLKQLICAAEKVSSLVLIDEAYVPFYKKSILTEIKQHSNLIVSQTFSKAWGLAGIRLGYAATSPALAKILHTIRAMYEVGALSLFCAEKILDFESDMRESVNRLNEGKQFFCDEMQKIGLSSWQTHGNFFHIKFGTHASKIHEALSHKVLYRRDFNEPCLQGYSRFSSAPIEQLTPIVEIIKSVVREKI